MKKTVLIYLLIFSIQHTIFGQVHNLPNHLTYYSDSSVNENDVLDRVNEIINNHLVSLYESDDYLGDKSIYYSRRVLSHIQLYYYYDNIGDFTNRDTHLTYLQDYFIQLLNEQCINYSEQNYCSGLHGGFPSTVNNDTNANPRTTAVALRAYIEARDFYENLGVDSAPISCEEFEDRIEKAKDALYSYSEFNDQYLNLTAFAFKAAVAVNDFYKDDESLSFLLEKSNELMYNLHPLRPNDNDEHWDYSWEEGYQTDGSWKDFGRGDDETPCNRWHDSQLDYHAIMIEGLAELYRSLDDSPLKNNIREKLIGSINHIIDYNGITDTIENAFNSEVTTDLGNPSALSQTRLTNYGRLSKYHREITDCDHFNLNKKVVGIGFLRSLILSKHALILSPEETQTIDNLITGITSHILVTLGGNGAGNLPVEQLYDLTLFLNQDNLKNIDPYISNEYDKLVVSFNDASIHSYLPNSCNNLKNTRVFYAGNQLVENTVSGDFNGDAKDELIVAFQGGNIYRYHENETGNLVTNELFYNSGQITTNLKAGDFDGDGNDELIIGFQNGEIYRYHENEVGNLVINELFYNGNQAITGFEAGDFDGNGNDELIIGFQNGEIYRYHENELGNLVINELFYDGDQAITGFEAGDFDGDGNDELIVGFQNGEIYRYHENELGVLVINELFYNGGQGVTNLKVGDFDGDGNDELIVAFQGGNVYRYHENELGNLVTNELFYNGGQITTDLKVGDFDGDGNDELIIGFQNGEIYRYHENEVGDLAINEFFYNDNQTAHKIVVLKKNITSANKSAHNNAFSTIEENELKLDVTLKKIQESLVIEVIQPTHNISLTLEVYDVYGRLIFESNFTNRIIIKASDLVKGLNIISIKSDRSKKVIKIIQ